MDRKPRPGSALLQMEPFKTILETFGSFLILIICSVSINVIGFPW